MADELSDLRRAFDERLIGLEAALSDPDNSPPLDALVLDFVRAAGDEADATARDAVLRAQRDAHAATAAALAEAQQVHVLLDTERALCSSLHSEIETLREHIATAVNARHDTDGGRQRQIADLTATTVTLQRALDEARRAAESSAAELASATARAGAATRDRDALVAERDGLVVERERLVSERADLRRSRETDAARALELVELKAAMATLQRTLDEARRAAAGSADALSAAAARADAATRDRDALVAERDGLLVERERLVSERADLRRSREADAAREGEIAELKAAIAQSQEALDEARRAVADGVERLGATSARADAAAHDRDALAAERDSLLREKERLTSERDDFLRAHDALTLQRDTIAHERDDVIRERDREIARLRDELSAPRTAARAPAPSPPATKAAAPPPKAQGPERKSDRQAFSSALGVQIDGEAALLVDLSLTGAQVLSCSSLKPAKTVKMLLPSSESPVLCRGRIVWARLEPTTPGKPIRYRAGMHFTAADEAAVQTFITRHGARN